MSKKEPDLPVCAECKHYSAIKTSEGIQPPWWAPWRRLTWETYRSEQCTRAATDIVSGESYKSYLQCADERSEDYLCGADGRFFEPSSDKSSR